jgi:hypothetical protein
MKYVGRNHRFAWLFAVTAHLTFLPAIGLAQGRPSIIWAGGGHSGYELSVILVPLDRARTTGFTSRKRLTALS